MSNLSGIWILCMFLPAAAAGVVQGVSGFGFGIVMMMVYPYFISITDAAFLCQCLSIFMCLSMVIKYFRYINWRLLPLPLAIYAPCYFVLLKLSASLDMSLLKPMLGAVLIVLSVYMLFIQGHIAIRPVWYITLLCVLTAAALDSFFGIGGPTIVLYYLCMTDDKEIYLGTIQAHFLIVCIYGTLMRIINGMAPESVMQIWLLGAAGMLIGMLLSVKIVARLDGEKLKKVIYAVIGSTGLITLIGSL